MVAPPVTGQPNRLAVPRPLTLHPKSCFSVILWSPIASHSDRIRSQYEAYCQAWPTLRSSSISHRSIRPYLFPIHLTWIPSSGWRGSLSRTPSTHSGQPSIGSRRHGDSLVRPLLWRHDDVPSHTDSEEGYNRRTQRSDRLRRCTKSPLSTWSHTKSA